MRDLWQSFVKFFTSLRLTVVLLALGIVLVFLATLAQVRIGVWGVQNHFFHTFFAKWEFGGTLLPVFPGGYFIGGLLFLNLVFSHIYRLQLTWKKLGIQLAHAGVILLLVGELFAGLLQEDYQMSINEGESRSYAESFRDHELALVDTSKPDRDEVVVIPEKLLGRGGEINVDGKLPFRVVVKNYFPNSGLGMRDAASTVPALATVGIGQTVVAVPQPEKSEGNSPSSLVELIGPGGSLGTWLVSAQLRADSPAPILRTPQVFENDGRRWRIQLRLKRDYQPFSLTLLKVTHDIYPGTTIPKNFSSRVLLKSADGRDDREALIYMNNPLRHRGLTFYQYQMDAANRNTVLQVVRNPSWTLPYVSCALVSLGLLIQFGISLGSFVNRRKTAIQPVLPT